MIDQLLKDRYFVPGEETWGDLCSRVSNFLFPDHEQKREHLYRLMEQKKFIPSSPTLMNAGTNIPMCASCFALGISDDMDSIMEVMKRAAKIFKMGGGVGIDFSNLRPKGSKIGSTGGTSDGVIPFMELFNQVTDTVKQGAKRRGAAISTLDISHPDVIDFIKAKTVDGKLSNMNISVRVTDEFMEAVRDDEIWVMEFGDIVREISARELWDIICESAHKYGDPGIVFSSTIKRTDRNHSEIQNYQYSQNPCMEAVLLIGDGYGEQCNLGSIDISKYRYTDDHKLAEDIELAIDTLNAVIDKTIFPHPDIEMLTKKFRRVGLGYMGIADRLIKDGVSFGSPEGNKFIYDITKFINDTARKYSDKMGYNNLSVTCLAPTGSLALIAGCSAGIEPNFAYVYDRSIWKDNVPVKHRMVHPLFEKHLRDNYDDIRRNAILEHMYSYGTIQNCLNADSDTRRLFVTAKDLTPVQHLASVEMAQKNIEMGISKTINMPNSATVDDVKFVYERAWRCGLKGVTIYREGSKEVEVLSSGKDLNTEPPKYIIPQSHPDVMDSLTVRRKTGCGTLWVTLTVDSDGRPFAVFIKNSDGGCSANVNAIARMISANLRSGVDVKYIIEQLKSEKCTVAMKNKNSQGLSCSHIIGCIIEDYINGKITQRVRISTESDSDSQFGKCPECGAILMFAEGCRTCNECGWSKCS